MKIGNSYKYLGLLLMAGSLSACGGGDNATNKYDTNITFPAAGTKLTGVEQITVSGQTADREDGQIAIDEINSITINDVPVVFNIDDSGRWSAQIPLQQQMEEVTVNAVYNNGESDTFTFTIDNEAALFNTYINSFIYDAEANQILAINNSSQLLSVNLTDSTINTVYSESRYSTRDVAQDSGRVVVVNDSLDALLEIDVDGTARVISDANIGGGPLFVNPVSVVLDVANNRAFVTDNSNDSIILVDLNSGQRRVITDATTGSGPLLSNPYTLVLDQNPAANRLFVRDSGLNAVVAVDINTGMRTIVSSSTIGAGPVFNYTRGMVLDNANNRLLVDSGWQIIAIDVTTGNRTIFSGDGVGLGPYIGWTGDIQADFINNRVLVTNTDGGAILSIALDTGDRTELITPPTVGEGIDFDFPQSIVLDSELNQLIVVDEGNETLVSVDVETGNRSLLSGYDYDTETEIGTGASFDSTQGLALDAEGNRVIVIDNSNETIIAVDLTTGNRTVLSGYDDSANDGEGAEIGTGPSIYSMRQGIALNADNTVAYVLDNYEFSYLLAIDLTTGNRTVISGGERGLGDSLLTYTDALTFDAVNNRVLIADDEEVMAVDIETGDRAFLSSYDIGTGTNLDSPQDMQMTPSGNGVYVVDNDDDILFYVDLTTGDRTEVSGDGVGNGPELSDTEGLAIDFDKNIAYVVNDDYPAIIVIDLNSGDRAFMSLSRYNGD